MWKVEILYDEETGEMKVNYEPNSEIAVTWMLRRAERTVFDQPQEPKRAATALGELKGWGKLTVEKKRKDA